MIDLNKILIVGRLTRKPELRYLPSGMALAEMDIAYNRRFRVEQLGGFCRVCRFRDVCRGGCSWDAWARGGGDNENCFYYQAVKHRRLDLLPEAPAAEETGYFVGQDAPS